MSDRRKRSGRKPRGTSGLVRVQLGGTQSSAEFHPTPFPESKEELENFVVNSAFRTDHRSGLALHGFYGLNGMPERNPENDFDFGLRTRAGDESLELMEIAPLEAGGYDAVPPRFAIGDRANAIMREVLKKSEKYGRQANSRIHLLLYVTDWRFAIGPELFALLAFLVFKMEHPFSSVVYCVPHAGPDAVINLLFPLPAELFERFDESAYRQGQTIGFDPRGWHLSVGGCCICPGFGG